MKKKFGELLLERGLITQEQLADALALQRRRGMRLGAALVARGHMTETQLVQALGAVLQIPVVDLTKVSAAPEAVKLISSRFAEDHDLIPYALRKERGRRVLSVAMSDPLNYRAIDELSFMTDSLIEPALARSSDIERTIRKHFGQSHGSSAYGKDVTGADLLGLTTEEEKSTMTILRKGGAEETVDVVTGKIVSPFIRGPDGSLLDNPAVTLPDPVPATPKVQARGEEISAVLLTEEVADSTPLSTASFGASGGMGIRPLGAPQVPPAATTNSRGVLPTRPAVGPPATAPQSSPLARPIGAAPVPQASSSVAASLGFATGLTPPPVVQSPPQPSYASQPQQQPQAAQSQQHLHPQPQVQPQAAQSQAAAQAKATPPPLPAATAAPAPTTTNPYFDDALGALIDAAGGAVNADQFYRLERKFWALMRLLAKKGIITSDEFINELGEE